MKLEVIQERKPDWLRIQLNLNDKFKEVKKTLRENKLVTVCEEAHCPNINECWNSGTATFMILGDTCTRGCRFCNVKTGRGKEIDKDEPQKLANVIKEWKLNYIVITSVDRDDLKDQGSGHFNRVIKKVKQTNPNLLVEVLIPDFRGNKECLEKVKEAEPDVVAHNIETVRRLQRKVRDVRANYEQSLSVLKFFKDNGFYTKSSLMLGLGETEEEVIETMKDLRNIDVDFFTMGQYLRPSQRKIHLAVCEYIHPLKFEYYKKRGLELGFKYVASGPFVRSSYRAGEFYINALLKQGLRGDEQ